VWSQLLPVGQPEPRRGRRRRPGHTVGDGARSCFCASVAAAIRVLRVWGDAAIESAAALDGVTRTTRVRGVEPAEARRAGAVFDHQCRDT